MDFSCVENMWFSSGKDDVNYVIDFADARHGFNEGVSFITMSNTWWDSERTFDYGTLKDNKKDVTVKSAAGFEVTAHYRFSGNCVRQYNTFKNTGDKPLSLINFTSATVHIPCDGVLPWWDERKFNVYACLSSWSREAQWRKYSLPELGLGTVRAENSGTPTQAAWRSEGSWSSSRYYPLIIIEDLESGRTYFMEHEGGCSWEIVLGRWAGDGLQLSCGSADLNHDGWYETVEAGNEYSTTSALYGYVDGTFEDAVRELTSLKRELSLRKWKNGIPVCYNVFMGGVWGEPTDRNLIPLIDAASEAGCEVFCIDAGWYRPEANPAMYGLLGDYIPDKDRFGVEGLSGILRYITSKGMIPGLWFEFEAVNIITCGGHIQNGMIKRNGDIISPERGIFDLCNEDVRNHLFDAIDRAYKLGMRYIKNDHNYSTGIGFGERGDNFNEEAKKRMRAFESFIDEIYRRYPDIIIENCGSGAMRSDNGTLSHFHVQSTSDQERYYNYPAIAAGSLALMPPEKAGNWVYPYATTSSENNDLLAGKLTPDYLAERYADGEITAFNMVTGFLGCMFISGRLDFADDTNMALIREATGLYKSKRDFIAVAHGVFPSGFSYAGKKGWYSAGLFDGKKLLLAVWKINSGEEYFTVELEKYFGKNSSVKMLYPANDGKCTFGYAPSIGRLTVKMSGADCMARLFEFTV